MSDLGGGTGALINSLSHLQYSQIQAVTADHFTVALISTVHTLLTAL